MLYIIPTPIGNLQDITFRAVAVLKSCDYILCEDTRHSAVLLHHYEIATPLKSFHQWSEAKKEDPVIADLLEGKTVALISDAGTPSISDPGQRLIKRCVEEAIPVTALPGACAAIVALSCSGMPSDRFQFIGFLPRKSTELSKTLADIFFYPGTSICYESPHRLLNVLETINKIDPQKEIAVARELTKKFEEVQKGTAAALLAHFTASPPKGEFVLLIAGLDEMAADNWDSISPQEQMSHLEKVFGLPKKEALKLTAELRGISKKELYRQIHCD